MTFQSLKWLVSSVFRFAKGIWRVLAVLLLALSLAVNVLLFGGYTLGGLLDLPGGQLNARNAVLSRDNAQLRQQLDAVDADHIADRRVNSELRAKLAEQGEALSLSRASERKLRTQMAEHTAELMAARAGFKLARQQSEDIAKRVASRTAKAAARDTASMAGEAIPFWGIAVIAAATSLEIYDMCQTIIDMRDLQKVFDPDQGQIEEELTVCNMSVPKPAEIWDSVSQAPGKAWETASGAIPTVEELSDFDPDWSGILSTMFETVSAFGDDAAQSAADKLAQVLKWLND
ncbi:hypothetical protein KO516_08445 [Citreicella sp. C3M06]|uniref:hypothetical protein n=1 Tax=Citreicella sp. C3M06 TaxID=2841564 RepID=UPI001C081203|nr:hypothetical protein [Citreicella sp. C3M06]MBU2960841.1 hypothetical protein [Citreicella sp. C3M06]